MDSLYRYGARTALRNASRRTDALERKVKAAEEAVAGMFDQAAAQVRQLHAHLTGVNWIMSTADRASFDFRPSEGLVWAVPAEWEEVRREDGPDGILYLTDQRLIFERNEEVATKKFLFITVDSEKVQQKLFEVSVNQIESVKPIKSGLGEGDQYIELTLGAGAPFAKVSFHLLSNASADWWQGHIMRVKSGEIDRERIELEKVKAIDEALAAAPTHCASCGAAFTQEIVRGMTEITCAYCGAVTRLKI